MGLKGQEITFYGEWIFDGFIIFMMLCSCFLINTHRFICMITFNMSFHVYMYMSIVLFFILSGIEQGIIY